MRDAEETRHRPGLLGVWFERKKGKGKKKGKGNGKEVAERYYKKRARRNRLRDVAGPSREGADRLYRLTLLQPIGSR